VLCQGADLRRLLRALGVELPAFRRGEAAMMDETRRNEVLAQLHHKLLGEPFEQPSAAEVEEVAWWEACELDRVTASRDHLSASTTRERTRADGLAVEVGRLRAEVELAWGLIANAGGGVWTKESSDWQEAAARWRDNHFGVTK
jgi:hypothetical protein